MTQRLTCRHCKETITGTDEDDLVARVQAHVQAHSREHGRRHTVSPEQVRIRLRRSIQTTDGGDAAD
jgi:hypothetical protein